MNEIITENDVLVLFSKNVRRLRELEKMSQSKLSERSGCSINFVSDIENYKRGVSIKTIANLSHGLNVEPFQLFLPERLFEVLNNEIYEADLHNILSNAVHDIMSQYFNFK